MCYMKLTWLAVSPLNRKIKDFHEFLQQFYFVLFAYLSLFGLTNCKKQFYDNIICYMTGENPVSWLAQFVFINLYVYPETGLNRSTS